MSVRSWLFNSLFIPVRAVSNLIDSPALILLFHRVTTLETDPELLAVTPENFEAQLTHLKNRCNVLTIEEFLYYKLLRKPFPRNSVLLTFDDGYADNLTEALPILESFKIQALFYITTSQVGSQQEFWWDRLARVVEELPRTGIELQVNNQSIRFRMETARDRQVSYTLLHRVLKYSSAAERDQILSDLTSTAGLVDECRPSYRLMTEEEVKGLSQSPSAVIGAHTHNHVPLSILTREEQETEIRTSRTILESVTGKPINHFSYPYGLKKDYTRESVQICQNLNFSMVCSNYYNQVHSWTSPYELPRVIIRNWSPSEFQEKIRKFFLY